MLATAIVVAGVMLVATAVAAAAVVRMLQVKRKKKPYLLSLTLGGGWPQLSLRRP